MIQTCSVSEKELHFISVNILWMEKEYVDNNKDSSWHILWSGSVLFVTC
jgi:hypothetical protein